MTPLLPQRFRPRARLLVAAVAAPALLLLAACSPTTVVNSSADAQRVVSVSATGSADAVPDAARASITVQVTNPTDAAKAQQDAAAASAKVMDALTAAGVDKADIATQGLSVAPVYNYTADQGQQQAGYQASQTYQVTLRSLDTAGATLDAVVAAAGNAAHVDSVTPFVTDPTVAAKAAREQAVKVATAQAQQYAQLLGFTLGPVASVTESSSITPPPIAMADASANGTAAKAPTEIQAGTTQVTVSLNVSWAIQ
jgi:uncharacterized protein YggE